MTDQEKKQIENLASLFSQEEILRIKPGWFFKPKASAEKLKELQNTCSILPKTIALAREVGTELEVLLSQECIDLMLDIKNEQWLKEHQNDEIKELGIDIETFSPEPISDCGVYRYAEHPDFKVLLFAYSVNGGPVQIVDIASGEKLPDKIMYALVNPNVLKTAFNARFERICLSHWIAQQLKSPLHAYLPPQEWDCTMIRCARLSLPISLSGAAKVLGVVQKMEEGKDLIRYFSVPCKPTKANGGRTRNLPEHAPEKWAIFKKYCKRDVEVEQALRKKVCRFEMPAWETELDHLDSLINDRGVLIDTKLVTNAVTMGQQHKEQLIEEAKKITGLKNPNSVTQLKAWLESKTETKIEGLNKQTLPDLKTSAKVKKNAAFERMLQIREELAKTSTTKYQAMLNCVCKDGRIRGLLQFCGAVRTGRWAGRLVQVQNLPQNHLKDLDRARKLVLAGDLEEMELNYSNIPSVLSELIRTAFIAKPGFIFHVCDFSAIEARVIAWLANEEWVLEVFRTHGKIYEAAASRMYNVPIEEITKTDPRRQKGKIATLALGYQGGVGALDAMGAARMGLTEEEEAQIVKDWRAANPNIVRLWHHVEDAAKNTIKTHTKSIIEKGITFEWKWGGLFVTLPSGRPIYYPRAGFLDDGRICYEGQNQLTRKWEKIETYGGKMTENIVQAIARDCLGVTMLRLAKKGFLIVFHIHDECINEANESQTLEQIEEVFKQPIPWAKGLPLKGAGYSTPYYLKD